MDVWWRLAGRFAERVGRRGCCGTRQSCTSLESQLFAPHVCLADAKQPPPVHLYFDFLTTYTLSLLPLSFVSVLFHFLTPADSYPPLYAIVLSLYSTAFVAFWRIRERKLAMRWGTRGCESVAVGRLRPEYVANQHLDQVAGNAVDAIQMGSDLSRDVKVSLSVPVIAACGVGLGCVLMGIFIFEAFVTQVYEGIGSGIVVSLTFATLSYTC